MQFDWSSRVVPVTVAVLLAGCGGGGPTSSDDDTGNDPPVDTVALTVQLGEMLFMDQSLSEPAGQSCATCHDPGHAFADPDVSDRNPVSEGVVAGRFGNRNAPTATYAALIPEFEYDGATGRYRGGQFLDGRAVDLKEQAKGPFLNKLEMANTDEAMVVEKLRAAPYAEMFEQIWGAGALDDVAVAYDHMAEAIAAFEETELFMPFTSKYDYCADDNFSCFTEQEKRGLDLFRGKGLCTECHIEDNGLFTDFTYRNIGVPPNPNNPYYAEEPDFIDVGLEANPMLTVDADRQKGKFRVPTLRNVAVTAPYMHNGVMQTLAQVVNFYNRRDQGCYGSQVPLVDCWPDPEVAENMETGNMGDLLLSAQEEADLVAFLETLTDGYQPTP